MTIKMANGIDLKKFPNLKFITLLSIILIFPLNTNLGEKPWLRVEFQPITLDFMSNIN